MVSKSLSVHAIRLRTWTNVRKINHTIATIYQTLYDFHRIKH